MANEPLSYRLSMPDPRSHLFHVDIEIRDAGPRPLDVAMPAWTPGSYAIRNYAKHVRGLSARDASGRALCVVKLDKQTWRIGAPRSGPVRISYRTYAFELNPRGAHLDDSHGYANGAAVFGYPVGGTQNPCRLSIETPRGWRVFTGLAPAGRGAFHAASYDELVDAPVEIGPFTPWSFRVRGKLHRVVVHGRGNYDRPRLVRDLARIVEIQARLFGGLPYPDYLFLVHCTPERGGGLEHANSASLQVRPDAFRPDASYRRFLHLASHEFFHLWNVKRIRPERFERFDYARENHTTLLWAMEGITDYYAGLMLRRAGLISARQYLDGVCETLDRLERVPGRRVQSLSAASFDAWTHTYEPNEDTVNRTVSYYAKGAAVGMLLDLAIRARTGGRRSLDDVMRKLWAEARRGSPGIGEDGFARAAEQVAGGSLAAFFRDYVRRTREPDFAGALRGVGLSLTAAPSNREEGGAPASLGVRLETGGAFGVVSEVPAGSPAARGGLYPADEIVAVDGLRVDARSLAERVESLPPGRPARITLFRRGELRELTLRPGAKAPRLAIRPLPGASPGQRRAFRSWLSAPWKAIVPSRNPSL